ncbi:response regulator [Butyrivibrio sp. VCD2006]|uniref:response regulator n=1 Tax=Butyrivibrio sp. VCD2006 TaxID=1280664 RepID=UPI0004129CC1|nr:response regulator [Butyrivibrio sp. VCD2006]
MAILIVDDAEMNAELLAEMVGQLGFNTEIAFNGQEAIDLLRAKSYDLVFMDHLMPVMDGMMAMSVIKEENLCPDIPVVMVTANDSSADGQFYLNAGFSDYMQKPFSMDQIRDLLKKHGIIKTMNIGELWDNLSAEMKGMNLDRPKKYFLFDPTFYLEVLNEYMKTDTLEGIESHLEYHDASELKSAVRSAKDTARLIGADKMADFARSMELDLEEEDEKSFAEHLKGYRQLEKKLRKIISKVKTLKHSYS